MAYETIKVEVRGKVGLITLDRPKALNALNTAMMNEMAKAVTAFEDNRKISCMVGGFGCNTPPDVIHILRVIDKRVAVVLYRIHVIVPVGFFLVHRINRMTLLDHIQEPLTVGWACSPVQHCINCPTGNG